LISNCAENYAKAKNFTQRGSKSEVGRAYPQVEAVGEQHRTSNLLLFDLLQSGQVSLFCHFPGILNKRRKKENPER
jgi:hypothetical protein